MSNVARQSSHTVAVAEKNHNISRFLQWYNKTRQECNINQNGFKQKSAAGTKGGSSKYRPSKHKAPVGSYRSRIDDVSSLEYPPSPPTSVTVSARDTSIGDTSIGTSFRDSSVKQMTLPSNHRMTLPSNHQMTFPSNQSVINGFPHYNADPYYWWPGNPSQNWPYFDPSFSTAQSPVVASDRPIVVRLLNNRIKKCSGCETPFARKIDGLPPDPPNDLIISHEERRPFNDASNTSRLSQLHNVYYHPSIQCVRRYYPSFAGDLQVPLDIDLQPLHTVPLK